MNDYKKKLIIKIVLSVVCVAVIMFIAIATRNAFVSKADGYMPQGSMHTAALRT